MPHFFTDQDYETGAQAVLIDDDHHHLANVHRYKVDDVVIIKSTSFSYDARITSIERDRTRCQVLSKKPIDSQSVRLIAAIPLLKGGNTELALQKCTELGIDCFYLVNFERSIPELKNESSKLSRWQKIVHEASKQCMRDRVPEIADVVSSEVFFNRSDIAPIRVLLDLETSSPVDFSVLSQTPLCFSVGPEGGYTQREREMALSHGWMQCKINHNQLRAETAVISFAAILSYRLSSGQN